MKNVKEPLPTDTILKLCADAWGLSDFNFVRKMENIVYSCKRNNDMVFLRLTSPLRRSRPEIEAELNWIEHLAGCGVQVPTVCKDRAGNRILSITEGKQHFEAVVFSAISGEHPSEEVINDPQFLQTLGSIVATMHDASQRYEVNHHVLRREEWDQERGLRHAIAAAAAVSKNSEARERFEEVLTWMRKLSKTPQTYGLVHADLGALNLFVEKDGSIAIIDFDDSCYHWFAFDLAIVLYSMAGRCKDTKPEPCEQKWLASLLKGYRTIRPLSDEEEKLIPKFVEFACLRVFFWIEHHQTLHTFHDDAIEKVAQIKEWAMIRAKQSQQASPNS